MRKFKEAILGAQLMDLGYSGGDFTLYNGKEWRDEVWERLDRVLANNVW